MFHDITELSKLRIPTVSVVFGASTAGGAYQPGMSDYNIFVRGQSKVFLGGPPLVKMATGEDADDEELGGAEMHAAVSGLADYLADDELDAIRMCREVVAHLNWRKLGPGAADAGRRAGARRPRSCSASSARPAPARSTCARSSPASSTARASRSSSRRYGPTLVCGWASIHGFPVGILGNNGVLFSESRRRRPRSSSSCATRSTCRCCSCRTSPASWSAATTSSGGIIKNGSQDDQRGVELDGAAPHGDARRDATAPATTAWRARLRPALHVHLADREDRGDGPEADGRRDVDRPPAPGRTRRARPFDEDAKAQRVASGRGSGRRAQSLGLVRDRRGSSTTASSTRATRATWSASRCRPATASSSRARRTTASSGM